ncbi:hypothetical protein H9P43_009858 [Blastocladiella emersonii ATCC 22665]|nr:hypothetical protein H9P43_009858 [Blastocladiella emersonii ATCC 22665]
MTTFSPPVRAFGDIPDVPVGSLFATRGEAHATIDDGGRLVVSGFHNRVAAFIKSYETGRPIRVVRGPKARCDHAPLDAYRYDGLYRCTAWDGQHRFTLEREPGQPPLWALPVAMSQAAYAA